MKHTTKNRIRFARASRWSLMGLTATAALSLLVDRADAAVSLVLTPDGDGRGVVVTWGSGAFPHTGPNLSGSWQGPDGTTFSFRSGVFSEFVDFYGASVQGDVAGSGLEDLLFFGDEPNTGTGNRSFGPNGSYDLSYSYENLGTGASPVWSGQFTLRATPVDTDGDGIPDHEDACPNSIMSATVVIEECDSGVENTLFDDGCTLADLIQQVADSAESFGEFVSSLSHYTNELIKEGFLTGREKAALVSCAARSN